MANEPGSTEASASTDIDAESVFNSTAENEREETTEIASEQPSKAGQSEAGPPVSQDSSAQHRPALSADRPHFFSAQTALSRSMNALPIEHELGGASVEGVPALPGSKAWWEKQPYSAIAHLLALSGTLAGAWLFGILVAQILPGNFTTPPLQEAMLRRSSRLGQRLWHFSQLWQTPTSETRIESIPLPETGPLLAPIKLPPIERQPLIDELNSVETELLTLDRRLQSIEKRLGKPPYQGASVENRVNSLRLAIDPPVKPTAAAESDYKPTPTDPTEQLLEVAQLKITLPSDALFSPGASELKDTALLNQVLDQLVNYPKATIVIRSYSDNQAAATVSRNYTQQQAIALSEYLGDQLSKYSGNSRERTYRWITVGSGQSQPVSSNDDDTGRQRNRRIEILVDTRLSHSRLSNSRLSH